MKQVTEVLIDWIKILFSAVQLYMKNAFSNWWKVLF